MPLLKNSFHNSSHGSNLYHSALSSDGREMSNMSFTSANEEFHSSLDVSTESLDLGVVEINVVEVDAVQLRNQSRGSTGGSTSSSGSSGRQRTLSIAIRLASAWKAIPPDDHPEGSVLNQKEQAMLSRMKEKYPDQVAEATEELLIRVRNPTKGRTSWSYSLLFSRVLCTLDYPGQQDRG